MDPPDAQVIEQPRNESEAWVVETVRRLADKAGVGMPEVAIYDSPEMNAFATGATKNSALVAVSSGILTRMSRPELEAVLLILDPERCVRGFEASDRELGQHLQRLGLGAPWRVARRALEGQHVSALLWEPKRGGLFAGVHDG